MTIILLEITCRVNRWRKYRGLSGKSRDSFCYASAPSSLGWRMAPGGKACRPHSPHSMQRIPNSTAHYESGTDYSANQIIELNSSWGGKERESSSSISAERYRGGIHFYPASQSTALFPVFILLGEHSSTWSMLAHVACWWLPWIMKRAQWDCWDGLIVLGPRMEHEGLPGKPGDV